MKEWPEKLRFTNLQHRRRPWFSLLMPHGHIERNRAPLELLVVKCAKVNCVGHYSYWELYMMWARVISASETLWAPSV